VKPDGPSRTAIRVALRRATHQLIDRPVVFEDPLALRVIGAGWRAQVEADPHRFDRGWFARYLRTFLAARHRFSEDHFREALARGVRQYVLLGAGYDTSALRFGAAQPGLRAFEIDHPATQRVKRARLLESDVAVPPNVSFVPVDFEREALPEKLAAAGFDTSAATFFAWLGVTMYLTRAAFDETIRFVAARPPGSAVVFDYTLALRLQGMRRRFFFELMALRLRAIGEPWILAFAPDELTRDLRALGFGGIEDLGDTELTERYFRGRDDGLRVSSAARIVYAEVGAGDAPPKSEPARS
jgi:methyltransferase (TIGR00027 family)